MIYLRFSQEFIINFFFLLTVSNLIKITELQTIIDLLVLTENVTELNKSPTQCVYELRRGRTLVKNIIPETKNETLTFKYFFPKLLRTLKALTSH